MNLNTMHLMAQAAERMANPPRQPRTENRASMEELRQKVERQNLIIQTLLMLLLEKKVLVEEEFSQWLSYVDDLDGVRDGRIRAEQSPVACPRCGRNNPRGAARCLYCDEVFPMDFLDCRPEAR